MAPASKIRKVFVNGNYIPPQPRVEPQQVISSMEDEQSEESEKVALRGSDLVLEMGKLVKEVSKTFEYKHGTAASKSTIRQLLQEAGETCLDMGRAWGKNDWESVTYASLEASQTFQLIASAIQNDSRDLTAKNYLQQALAGIGVEFKVLSKTKQEPRGGNLQGLSLRFYQASQHSPKPSQSSFLQASRLMRDLAQKYGAKGTFNRLVPNKWLLWWRDSKLADEDEDEDESER